MVKTLFFLFFLVPSFLFSGEFIASVNRNQISQGESLTLNLTLKGASPQGSPSIGGLKKSFFINSQQQSSNTTVMNGHLSSSTTWKISLTPQTAEEAMIPPISINTSEGVLSSNPIQIRIIKGNPGGSDASEMNEKILTTELSKAKPYKNEPIFFTVRLLSKQDLADLKMQKFSIDDAIVEANGEPKIDQKIIEGIKWIVIEYSYLITPLKAGTLKIPSIALHGETPIPRKIQRGSFFDHNFDSFFMMADLDQLKPFTMTTKEVELEVQPAIAGMNPWLPAKALKIEEIWDPSQSLQVREPIIRGFRVEAEGILSSQLPNLNELQPRDPSFKIYADKPETGEQIKGGNISSFRKEQYTLIPQQAGILRLPEVSISWWDVTKNEKRTALIPGRTLQILPSLLKTNSPSERPLEEQLTVSGTTSELIRRDPMLYIVIGVVVGGLALLLFGAILWAIMLQKKIARLTEKPTVDLKVDQPKKAPPEKAKTRSLKEKKDKKEKLPDLNPT